MSELIYSPTPGLTRLVLEPEVDSIETANRETDAIGAVTRGLTDYLGQVYLDDWLGTRLVPQMVYDQSARAPERLVFPSVSVMPPEGDSPLGNMITSGTPTQVALPDGRYLISLGELDIALKVTIEATNQPQCQGMVLLVLQALNPSAERPGLMLDMPHYHDTRATFTWNGYGRGRTDAGRNQYSQTLLVGAQVPVIVMYPASALRTGDVIPYVTVELPEGAEQSYIIDNTDWPRRSVRSLGLGQHHGAKPPFPL